MVSENLKRVREELAAQSLNGRAVTVVGVTKFQPAERVREAVTAGLGFLANNYAQDGEKLMAELSDVKAEWHFIGHIQSRKVKYLTDYALVQSLDRVDIARMLNERAADRISVLVEVNVGDETSKSGIAPEALDGFLAEVARFPKLRVRGIMGMPPPLEPVEARRPFFRELRAMYDRHAAALGFDCLSMGTSADYLVAAQEGSTMVRLGTTLFGERSA